MNTALNFDQAVVAAARGKALANRMAREAEEFYRGTYNGIPTPGRFISAARVPETVDAPQEFGPWQLTRVTFGQDGVGAAIARHLVGPCQTILRRATEATMHLPPTSWEVVMEDSTAELARHLPIWLVARGRILVTGLGLGCVVRGLLASPRVEHVDVIELDADIIRAIGPEFDEEPRVTIHNGDALTVDLVGAWDFAWHDIWSDTSAGGEPLHKLHIQLFERFLDRAAVQGAWMLPRVAKRAIRRTGKMGLIQYVVADTPEK